MLHRLVLVGAAMLLLACALSACGGGSNGLPIDPATETQIILPSGGGAIFPAGAVAATTEVDVNEDLTGAQQATAGFPANSGALLGATTIKFPAGVALNSNFEVRIALGTAQATNLGFTVFSFNTATNMWETTAAVSSVGKNSAAVGVISGGNVVSFTATAAGTTGFNATYGVFEDIATVIDGGGGGTPNEIPTVDLVKDPTTEVDPDATVTLTATGADGDGDTLTFSWMAAGGTLGTPNTTGNTSTVTWSAATGGAYVVSVSVNDGNGGVATDAVTINVKVEGPEPPANDPPEFEGDVTGDVAAPVVGQRVWLTAVAHDPEEGEVSFDWSGPGSFADPTVDSHGARVFWTPDAAGSATVTCTASDPEGNETTADFVITVAAYPTAFDFVGYPTCIACHSDKGDEGASTGWFGTNHAIAIQKSLSDPTNAHAYRNPSCYSCHALGWNPNDQGQGFIDIDLTPELGNIQCETCHGGGAAAGMGADHKGVVWNPLVGMVYDETEMTWVPDDEFDASRGVGCGACHEGSRHGSVEEWAESGHANAELTEEDEDNPGTFVPHHYFTSSSCSPCHSGMQFATIQKGEDPLDLSGLTLDDPLEDHLVGCATCHDPHSNQFEAQLRVDSEADVIIPFDEIPVNGGRGNICISCHNGRRTRSNYNDQMASGSGHFGPHGNAQAPVLFGVMGGDLGISPADTAYETDHPHLSWNENSCTTCHMYRRPYIDSENPALWGHNFEPRIERCITCHSNYTVEDEEAFWTWVEEYEAEVDALLQSFRDAWPAAWLDEDGEPVNRDTDPPTGIGPPRDDPTGAAYRAALWNYMLIEEDGSHGIHNPTYVKSLIAESIASLETLPAP